jgi:hypothetical protein
MGILASMGILGFIKFVGYSAGGSLSLAFLHETGLLKKIGEIAMTNKVKMIDSFPLEHEHTTVLGTTRFGKTFSTIKSLDRMENEAVLFFNTGHSEDIPKSWVTFDPSIHEWSQMETLLSANRKINFIPSTVIEKMEGQLSYIVDKLYNGTKRNVRLVIDETHLFKKVALGNIIRVATTGLRWGIRGVFITQRPAKMDNTLYTQSTNHVIFALGLMDYSYLKNNGFPIDELQINEKYIFRVFNQREVFGDFKIKI